MDHPRVVVPWTDRDAPAAPRQLSWYYMGAVKQENGWWYAAAQGTPTVKQEERRAGMQATRLNI